MKRVSYYAVVLFRAPPTPLNLGSQPYILISTSFFFLFRKLEYGYEHIQLDKAWIEGDINNLLNDKGHYSN